MIWSGYFKVVLTTYVVLLVFTLHSVTSEGHDCYVSDTTTSTGQRIRQLISPYDINEDQCDKVNFGGHYSYEADLKIKLSSSSCGGVQGTTSSPTGGTTVHNSATPSLTDKNTSVTVPTTSGMSGGSTVAPNIIPLTTTSNPSPSISRTTTAATTKSETTTWVTTTLHMTTTPGPTPLPTIDDFDAASIACPILQGDKSFASCRAAYDAGYTTDGVYIMSLTEGYYRAYCDMTNEGWMVIQRRVDGSQLFNLTRSEYEQGFGNLCKEFFWGHLMLTDLFDGNDWKLRVTLVSFNGTTRYREYPQFILDKANYHCQAPEAGTGSAGDGLSSLLDQKFSTYDNDNDGDSRNLAEVYQTGWWFIKDATSLISNLNGVYYRPGETRPPWHGIIWVNDESLMETEMKIRYFPPAK